MTVHVLFTESPGSGATLPGLVEEGSLDRAEGQMLAEAMLKDTAAAVAASGGDLLVLHSPESRAGGTEPGTELRRLIPDALGNPESVRFEPQVGDSPSARIENAARDLLEEDDVASVAVLDGRVPTVDRTDLDGAGMKLRRSDVVVGPAPNGRLAYVGFTEAFDMEGLDWPFRLEALVERATAKGLEIDFLSLHPWVGDERDLETVGSLIGARRTANRRVPEHTAAAIDELGL